MCGLSRFTPIGLGTWNMEREPKNSIEALRAGIEAGANHIDTAEMYGDGVVEGLVGEAIHGIRDKVYLVSKVLPSHSHYKSVLTACEKSLKRLGTDYLDVYLLHWRNSQVPLEDTFRAFEDLKTQGKIKEWGVSNFDVSDMEEAFRVGGKGKIVCNQVYYCIKERATEIKLIPWCQKNGVTFVAYSPLGQGRLPDHSVLSEIAKDHKATSAQIALAFLLRNKDLIAVPKSSNIERTRENVKAAHIKLSADQIKRLENAFPAHPRNSLPEI